MMSNQVKEEYAKYSNEERLSQVKLIMNQIFRKHKETVKRGIKFNVPLRSFMQRCKIVQDDQLVLSLQEIHDYVL